MKRFVLAACVATAAASLSLSAMAATPKIQGSYNISYIETCQIEFSTTGLGPVQSFNTVYNGKITHSLFSGTLKNGTAKLSGFQIQGSMMIYDNINGAGSLVAKTPESITTPYSNTATTATLFGVTFGVLYNDVSNGIAQSFTFTGIPDSAPHHCAATGTATRTGN